MSQKEIEKKDAETTQVQVSPTHKINKQAKRKKKVRTSSSFSQSATTTAPNPATTPTITPTNIPKPSPPTAPTPRRAAFGELVGVDPLGLADPEVGFAVVFTVPLPLPLLLPVLEPVDVAEGDEAPEVVVIPPGMLAAEAYSSEEVYVTQLEVFGIVGV